MVFSSSRGSGDNNCPQNPCVDKHKLMVGRDNKQRVGQHVGDDPCLAEDPVNLILQTALEPGQDIKRKRTLFIRLSRLLNRYTRKLQTCGRASRRGAKGEDGEEGPCVLVPPAGPETQDALVLQDVLCLHCTIGSQADTTCMLSRGLFQHFLTAPEAFLERNWAKYMSRTLST